MGEGEGICGSGGVVGRVWECGEGGGGGGGGGFF